MPRDDRLIEVKLGLAWCMCFTDRGWGEMDGRKEEFSCGQCTGGLIAYRDRSTGGAKVCYGMAGMLIRFLLHDALVP